VGNRLYAQGGWVASGSANVGFIGAALFISFCRGPWEKGWLGWSGGWGIRRRDLGADGKVKKEEPAVEQVGVELTAQEGGDVENNHLAGGEKSKPDAREQRNIVSHIQSR